jgi:Polysaccharide biosynthesis
VRAKWQMRFHFASRRLWAAKVSSLSSRMKDRSLFGLRKLNFLFVCIFLTISATTIRLYSAAFHIPFLDPILWRQQDITNPFWNFTKQEIADRVRALPCNHSLKLETLAYYSKLEPEPILIQKQAAWIIEILHKSAPNPNFLIFGLGFDSALWRDMNPCGTSIFLEDQKKWIDTVMSSTSSNLNVFQVKYRQKKGHSVKRASNFFRSPHLIKMPPAVEGKCFHTVLLDAPMGFFPRHPGRQEAAYWTLQMAKRCSKSTNRPVYVFVHDAQRWIEREIIEGMYIRDGGAIDKGAENGRDEPFNLLRLVIFYP